MMPHARRAIAMFAVVAVLAASSAAHAQSPPQAQSCPTPLAAARRLVLVTVKSMNEPAAEEVKA